MMKTRQTALSVLVISTIGIFSYVYLSSLGPTKAELTSLGTKATEAVLTQSGHDVGPDQLFELDFRFSPQTLPQSILAINKLRNVIVNKLSTHPIITFTSAVISENKYKITVRGKCLFVDIKDSTKVVNETPFTCVYTFSKNPTYLEGDLPNPYRLWITDFRLNWE